MNRNRFISASLVTISLVFASAAFADDAKTNKKKKPVARKANPAMAKVEDVPDLPRVLLIGDSISIGYTVPVRKLMAGMANVHRPLTNCGPTTTGLAQIDKWIGTKEWDVIHFNWGLHDLKYMGPGGKNLANPKAESSFQQVPPAKYEANLRKLVARLRKTGAKLIWRSTTPVPEGCQGRVVGDSVKYNAIAKKIMDENGIEIDDQYSFCMTKLDKIQRPANVHFTSEGSAALAERAVKAINSALKD